MLAFDNDDRRERLNEAWSEGDPEPVKEILRLCARSGVRAISSTRTPERAPKEDDRRTAAPSPRRREPLLPHPSGTRPEAQKGDEINPQLPLDAS